jgi:hypothetical protein
MQVRGQLHALAALRPEKKASSTIPLEQEDIWTSESIWTLPYQESKYIFPVAQLILFSKLFPLLTTSKQ